MMKRWILAPLLVAVASPALAGGVIATPALYVPPGGYLTCSIANVSATKTVTVDWNIYAYDGVAEFSVIGRVFDPLENVRSANQVTKQSSCVVTVTSGSPKNIRVALIAIDSTNTPVASVEGR